jgi:glutaredoxin
MKKLILVALAVSAFFFLRDGSVPGSGMPSYADTGKTVTLYATEWCGYCAKTRAFFEEHEVPYVELDIEKSEQGAREHARLGGNGIPVVVVDETVIHGFSPDRMLAALDAP